VIGPGTLPVDLRLLDRNTKDQEAELLSCRVRGGKQSGIIERERETTGLSSRI